MFDVRRSVFWVLLLAALVSLAWTPLPQEGGLVVRGQVTNGTPGGGDVEGLEVTLHLFTEGEETKTLTTSAAADGSFLFNGLTAADGATLWAQVTYQGVDYFSESVVPGAGRQELELPITVYETTEEPTNVLVTQLHIFMTGMGDRLQVGEYYLIGNTGDRTYIGGGEPETGRRVTLRFTLPEGAGGLGFDGPGLGERFLEWEGGFADTEPVPPGTVTSEVLFRYELPYRDGFQVERVFEVPVASVVLVVPGEGVALEGPALTPAGTVDTQMGLALSYTAGPLAAGESLAFTLVAEPAATAPVSLPSATAPPAHSTARETAVGLVALAAAVMVAYLLWRPAAPPTVPPTARPLVEAIAALDESFEAGEIQEGAYRAEREKLKRRLRRLLERGSG